jgi:hypothetical protein
MPVWRAGIASFGRTDMLGQQSWPGNAQINAYLALPPAEALLSLVVTRRVAGRGMQKARAGHGILQRVLIAGEKI